MDTQGCHLETADSPVCHLIPVINSELPALGGNLMLGIGRAQKNYCVSSGCINGIHDGNLCIAVLDVILIDANAISPDA